MAIARRTATSHGWSEDVLTAARIARHRSKVVKAAVFADISFEAASRLNTAVQLRLIKFAHDPARGETFYASLSPETLVWLESMEPMKRGRWLLRELDAWETAQVDAILRSGLVHTQSEIEVKDRMISTFRVGSDVLVRIARSTEALAEILRRLPRPLISALPSLLPKTSPHVTNGPPRLLTGRVAAGASF